MTALRLQKTDNNIQKKSSRWKFSGWTARGLPFILAAFWLGLSACSTDLQTRVSGNLDQLSQKQTIAILPVEFVDKSQREAANMFRQSLYANLKESEFNLLEPSRRTRTSCAPSSISSTTTPRGSRTRTRRMASPSSSPRRRLPWARCGSMKVAPVARSR